MTRKLGKILREIENAFDSNTTTVINAFDDLQKTVNVTFFNNGWQTEECRLQKKLILRNLEKKYKIKIIFRIFSLY